MDYFRYRQGRLFCEEIPVEDLARDHGTPLYVYSARTILEHYHKLREAFTPPAPAPWQPILCYSIKANSNLSILRLMAREGSGFDVVSGGEIYRALKVGADPRKIVYAGVGKTDEEIEAGLRANLLLFNVESEEELENTNRLAGRMGKVADVALRINPDVDPQTHTYIATGKRETKFGVDLERARRVFERAKRLSHVRMTGLHVHIGSQITKSDPYADTLKRVAEFVPEVRAMGHPLEWLDMGGGFGIWYKEKLARSAREIADACLPLVLKTGLKLLLEPGRFIVGNAGILLARVLYVKESGDKRFVICDAGMNDLIRPALYGAYHRIWPAATDGSVSGEAPDEERWPGPAVASDVVGPICESGDFLAKDRRLPLVRRGDLLAVFSAGAYGYVMASHYNSYPKPAEVLVRGTQARVVSRRETYEDVIAAERIESLEPGARGED
ncbi:MAG: diaminopimelate decarboxylase [Planctomycetes bacterium]|nr:diaminopimelate decarboxylase [Planctomycetota bacterium]